jgi:hypothetical protein
VLTGGNGDEAFRFSALAERADVITDFTTGDYITASAAGFGGGLVDGMDLGGR